MYFLINDSDKSVNCVSEEPFPQFMIHEGLTAKELPVDHIPPEMHLVDCFYDEQTDSIIPNTLGLQRLTEHQFAEYINQQQAIAQAITRSDALNYSKLVTFLSQVFPDSPEIASILSDDTVTQDELQQIENMLNAK